MSPGGLVADISLHEGPRGLLQYCSCLLDPVDYGGVKSQFVEYLGGIWLTREGKTLFFVNKRSLSIRRRGMHHLSSPVGVASRFGGRTSTVGKER